MPIERNAVVKKKSEPFQPSASETKARNTTLVAKNFIEEETATRDAKTKRLRAARLQREASEPRVKKAKTKQKVATFKRTET